MKKLALGALLAGLAAACGGGGGSNTANTIVLPDGGGGDGGGACNPLMQTGCSTGEKCNWIYDQLMPTIVGHIGCEPAGSTAIGGDCGPRAVGADSCVKGAECVSGECKQICDNQGGAPMCDPDHSCVQYQDTFTDGTTTVAGVCDPGCDPLTQKLKVGDKEACGSADPTKPTKGCYGYNEYSCSGVAPTVDNAAALALTDRVAPAGDYLNSCAPGYMPVLIAMTGVTTGLCNGLCAAKELDNTKPVADEIGDALKPAKNPTAATAAAGNAVCSPGKRGSALGGAETCRFMWPFNVDDAGMLEVTEYTDVIGVCFARSQYKYDSNGDGMLDNADKNTPSCTTAGGGTDDGRPARTATTTGDYDDAADFGCETAAHSEMMFTSGALQKGTKVYVGEQGIQTSSISMLKLTDGPVPVRRHVYAN